MAIVRWVFEDPSNFGFSLGFLMLAAILYCIVAAMVWLALEVYAEDWMKERSLDLPTAAYCWLPILVIAPYALPIYWATFLFERFCMRMTSGEQVICAAVWPISIPVWLLWEGVACGFGGVWIGGQIRMFLRRRLRTLREDKDLPIPAARVHEDRSDSRKSGQSLAWCDWRDSPFTYLEEDIKRAEDQRKALKERYGEDDNG